MKNEIGYSDPSLNPSLQLSWPVWTDFTTVQQGGILVVGHGTRNRSGVGELIDLVQSMRDRLPPGVPIEASFLELANPSIEEAIEKLRLQGCKNLLVIPILLFSAGHARQDIPDAVASAIEMRSMKVVAQSTSLGTEAAALKLSQDRFLSSLRCRNRQGCLKAGACDIVRECIGELGDLSSLADAGLDLQNVRIGLAMVGRGTSELEARGHMLRLTGLRIESSPIAIHWSQTGFFAGGAPTVADLLAAAEASDCDWIVVQPHLLFEGQLSVQLRSMVDSYRQAGSKKRWLVAPTLGADPQLAETFLDLGKKSILGIASNGC